MTLNRPEALNAITNAMLVRLSSVLDELADDTDVGVIVLTGEGSLAFPAARS